MTYTAQNRNKRLLKTLLDLGVFVGAMLFIFGLYQIWHPLAPLVGGLMLIGACGFAGYDRMRQEGRR